MAFPDPGPERLREVDLLQLPNTKRLVALFFGLCCANEHEYIEHPAGMTCGDG